MEGHPHLSYSSDAPAENFELRAKEGSIHLSGLRFRAGTGAVHTDDGSVSVGIIEDDCSLTYEAQSMTGAVRVEAGRRATSNDQLVRGTLGEGRGQLTMRTYAGDVYFGPVP